MILVTFLYGALFLVFQSPRFKLLIETELSARTGYEIGLGEIYFRPPFRVVGSTVTVAKSSNVLFTTSQVALTLNPLDLFSKTIHRVALAGPVIYLDLRELLQASSQTSPGVAMRHLNVQEGTVVLKTAEHKTMEFSSIDLNAQNLNLGQTTGVTAYADVPWLDAEAELSFKQQKQEKEAEVILRPQPSNRRIGFPGAKKQAKEMLRLQAKFKTSANAEPNLTLIGKFDELKIGPKPLTGALDARIIPNADFTGAALSARIEVADFPNGVSPIILEGSNGVAVANVTGKFSAPDNRLALTAFRLDSPLGTAEGRGNFSTHGDFIAEDARLILRKVPWQTIKRFFPEPLNRWSYQGTGVAELNFQGPWRSLNINGTVNGDALQIKGAGFSLATLAVHAPVVWKDSSLELRNISLKGKSLNFSAKDRLETGAEQVQIDGSLTYKADEPLAVTAQLQLAGGRFASADSTKVGENLALEGTVGLMSNSAVNSSRITGKLSLIRGEILWGKFFADLGGQRPVLHFDGDYLRQRDSVQFHRAGLTLASTGSIEINGSVSRLTQAPAVDLNARSENIRAGGFFELFLRETFKRRYPILDKLNIVGQIGLELHARGNLDRLTAAGRVTLQGGEVRSKSNDWQIASIALTLPFELSYPAKSDNSTGTAPGVLSIRGGRFGSRSMPPVTTSLSLSNNALIFHQPLRLAIFGGSVEIADLAWPDIIKDPKEVSFAIDTRLLQLQELTEALGWHRFSGTLSGSIPQVRSSGDTLRTQGQIQADLFGGRLQISKMEIENPFSAIPSMKLDARFQDIRLEQASETFAFGKISGILEGVINDLVIADGQPARFQADIRTGERPASGQWISVEALNTITVLSSGQDSDVLYGGLASFFDNFRYSKLGFKATLRNDKLKLTGVESRDGKEFLVVGSLLPPTVNIISHTQEIGFSELLRRLERVQSDRPEAK